MTKITYYGEQPSNTYEIWLEGYAATGEHAPAQYLGIFEGEDFQEACINAIHARAWDIKLYDYERNAYWGCKFYDNEASARNSFG